MRKHRRTRLLPFTSEDGVFYKMIFKGKATAHNFAHVGLSQVTFPALWTGYSSPIIVPLERPDGANLAVRFTVRRLPCRAPWTSDRPHWGTSAGISEQPATPYRMEQQQPSYLNAVAAQRRADRGTKKRPQAAGHSRQAATEAADHGRVLAQR
ncbi:hypothetical protein NDU88_007521 [Pleurodeles waltl]|uniref:Uncharacterized protein n=1 Tax=Pleurodeles waltl TaxID=8319 RepID=A0AAV7VSU6_PLEWA|nr:hypothetical protein NDU88_007521 [Pleurodeles waltl]